MNVRALRLCFVTNLQNKPFHLYKPIILQAIEGGITSLQLRLKANQTETLAIARELKPLLDYYHIPLIINDDVEIARLLKAHLHIGPTDMSVREARKILGKDAMIGLSIETLDELDAANKLSGNYYVAASAVFRSKTKATKTIWQIAGLKKITAESALPVMGIGGITEHNVGEVIEAGAIGAAVIGAIHDSPYPTIAAANMLSKIDEALNARSRPCLRR